MKIVYVSRTGNVQSLVESLTVDDSLHIFSGTETVDEDYILFTYTDGYGEIPYEVQTLLQTNASHLKGVIVSGDPAYGEEVYCIVGDIISNQYNVPCLYKVENEGTQTDCEKIQEILDSI